MASIGLCCVALTACGPAAGDEDRARAIGGDAGAASTAVPPSGALFSSTDATTSCVDTYTPMAALSHAFAFDGEVVALGQSVSNRSDDADLDMVGVTFAVHEWFAGRSGDTFTVDMLPPDQGSDGSSESGPAYAVGSRLLVSGEPRWGGQPDESPIAWTCGFTRYYDQETAEQWRAAAASVDQRPST
jgi:hypothetical protein